MPARRNNQKKGQSKGGKKKDQSNYGKKGGKQAPQKDPLQHVQKFRYLPKVLSFVRALIAGVGLFGLDFRRCPFRRKHSGRTGSHVVSRRSPKIP